MNSSQCVIIEPIKLSDSEERIRAAIQFSSVLPVPGTTIQNSNEFMEKERLSSVLQWKNPQGLFGYSKYSEYKDLYIYFDYGDKKSPVNELATKSFSMYGLGGAMVGGPPTWGSIRGPAVIIRIEPDYSFSPSMKFKPNFSLNEIYDTIVFFRDSRVSAHTIAHERDKKRMMGSFMGFPDSSDHNFGNWTGSSDFIYKGPNDSSFMQGQGSTINMCDNCGKEESTIGEKMKRCARCKKVMYCDRECQKTAWKKHKKTCIPI